MQRIAGYAAPLEPGVVDPVQAQIVTAARAVAAGQALVCDSETGALLLVDPDYDLEMGEDELPVGVAGGTPPDAPVGEPPVHAVPADEVVLADEPGLVDEPGIFDEWEVELWFGDELMYAVEADGVPWSEPGKGLLRVEPGEGMRDESARGQAAVPLPGVAEVADEPGVRVRRLLPAGMESLPGEAELARALESVQLDEIGAYELVEFVAACQRMSSAMDALQASAASELSRRVEMRPAEGVRTESMTTGRITELEVGARLASEDQAGRLVSRAMLICDQLPETYALWRSGVLSTEKVDVMVSKLAQVDTELAREVEARVLPGAVNRTPASLRRQITRLLHKLAPEPAEKRHEEKKAERFARITPAPDGMAWLEAYLTAEDAAAVKATLDAGAATLKRHDDAFEAGVSGKGTAGNPASRSGNPSTGSFVDGAGFAEGTGSSEGVVLRSTAGNRRADVLAALAWAALSTGWIGGRGCGSGKGERDGEVRGDGSVGFGLSSVHGRPVSVNVTVALSSLLGENEEPGELAGFGPITAESARRLAADGTWRRIVIDPLSGAVLDVGRTRYTPPRELADHVMARDQRCRWPTCDRPASGVGIHLDHTVAFENGGATAHTNLGVFCGRNHVDKHQAGWTVVQPEPGRFVYTSPTGHVYAVDPEPVGPADGDAVGAPPPF